MTRRTAVFLVLFIVAILNGVGLLALSSMGAVIGAAFFKRQLLFTVLSWLVCYIFSKISLRFLLKHRNAILKLGIIGVILVLIPGIGHVVNGSRRWIYLGLNLQVSEFAKIALIIWLAGYLSLYNVERYKFTDGFLKPISVCGFLSFFVLCEPDYGTTCLMMVTALAVLFLSGTRLRYLMSIVFLGIFAFLGLLFLSPVRLRRVTSFFDVEGHRFDATYQLWQGILCFAAGGLSGTGAGLGIQKLSYLPEAHTDFIFPVIAEELGGVVAILLAVCFFILAFVVLCSLHGKKNNFARLLGSGAVLIIVFEAVINIGVVTGCLPTKGIALPFVSYGGSNLVAMYSLIGLIINCINAKEVDDARFRLF